MFREICEFTARERTDFTANSERARTIFTNGYHMRNLVAGYRIFGERRYLDLAIAYGDHLLKLQSPRGYWGTGYGKIYLADTGSALGLFIVLYKHVDKERQRKYFDAIERYVNAIEADGLINPSGAIGTGWRTDKSGKITGPYADEYTISSSLTGAEIFTWMYHRTREDKYRRVAYRALAWIIGTMRSDGVIPYVLAGEGGDLAKKGDPQNDYVLWDRTPYLNSSYVAEGLLLFDRYSNHPEWTKEIRDGIRPHIEFLLRTQRPDGIWRMDSYKRAWDGAFDRTRSPGIINLLIWHHESVKKDPRVLAAVRKFNAFFLNRDSAKSFGILTAGAVPGDGASYQELEAATGLGGRALADILMPGVDAEW